MTTYGDGRPSVLVSDTMENSIKGVTKTEVGGVLATVETTVRRHDGTVELLEDGAGNFISKRRTIVEGSRADDNRVVTVQILDENDNIVDEYVK